MSVTGAEPSAAAAVLTRLAGTTSQRRQLPSRFGAAPSRLPIGIGAKIGYRLRPVIPDKIWALASRRPFSG